MSDRFSLDLEKPTEKDVLALTLTVYGEARGEDEQGRLAVAWTVVNRWQSGRWYGEMTVAETCRKPWQYSCWNSNDPNRALLEALMDADDPWSVIMESRTFRSCLHAAVSAIDNLHADPVEGSTHYFAWKVVGRPAWAGEDTFYGRIGGHEFHRGVD